jgi:hypothetical protein
MLLSFHVGRIIARSDTTNQANMASLRVGGCVRNARVVLLGGLAIRGRNKLPVLIGFRVFGFVVFGVVVLGS